MRPPCEEERSCSKSCDYFLSCNPEFIFNYKECYMSPYLMCPKNCESCPFIRDCYDKTFFDFGENVISADPVLEDLFFHSEKEN